MTLDEQAQALAIWLDENPGSPPPEGVDEDVLQAIYVFRPDLAPAPQVSIDDILGRVNSGPFAPPVPLQAARSGQNQRRFWRGAGVIAAAAAVLIIAIPQQEDAAQIGPQLQATPVDRPSAVPPVQPAPPAQLESKAKLAKAATDPPTVSKKEDTIVQQNTTLGVGRFGSAPSTDDEMDSDMDFKVEEALIGGASPSEYDRDAGSADASVAELRAEPEDKALTEVTPGAFSGAFSEALSVETVANLEDMAGMQDMEIDEEARPAPARSTTERGDRKRLFQRKARAKEATAAPAAAPAPVTAASNSNEQQSTTALAALALPADYRSPPANEAITSQWGKAEAARVLLQEQRYKEAEAMGILGSGISGVSTPQLSMIYYVIGRSASQLGRDQDARAAFEKAIALNAQRQ